MQGAFEAIDCGQDGIFENPSYIRNGQRLQTLWVNSFGILHYTRISYCTLGHFGVGIANFGNEFYRETEFLLGYSRLKGRTKLGVSMRGMNLYVKGYEVDFSIGTDFGVSFYSTSSFKVNIALHNINFPKIRNEEIPQRIIGGFIAELTPKVTAGVQFYKESMYPIEIRIRNKIKISELMDFSIGIKTYPFAFTLGVLFTYKRVSSSYFIRTHETLGLTHIIGIEITYVE